MEHTLDRELRELRKMSNQNVPQPRDRPSLIDSQQTNIFKQLHTETVKQKNLERRGGENTAVSKILFIPEGLYIYIWYIYTKVLKEYI